MRGMTEGEILAQTIYDCEKEVSLLLNKLAEYVRKQEGTQEDFQRLAGELLPAMFKEED